MKNTLLRISILIIIFLFQIPMANAQMKKVGQAGMTYLSIPISARESGMGNASVASVRGIEGIFHNPAALAQIEHFAIVVNQVNWLAETKLYGLAAAYTLGQYGTIGLDLVYMDYGKIIGTRRVDSSIDERGFILTGDIHVEEYAVGLAYAIKISEKFSFGMKLKYANENLGDAAIAVGVIDQEKEIYKYENRNWGVTSLGFDVGGLYDFGYKTLKFAAALQNYSGDMTYYTESFPMPMAIRFGLAQDVAEYFDPGNQDFNINTSLDAVNPVNYTGRVNIGAEVEYLQVFAVRLGYQFNQDVVDFSLGFGVKFDYQGYVGSLDYSYTNTKFFEPVNRFSLIFTF